MTFRILGLDPAPFRPLFDLDDEALLARGVHRLVAEAPHSAPCRVTLDDAEPGERLLLFSYQHQPAVSPFRASGPIFVREAASRPFDARGRIAPALERRTLSARAYDAEAMMVKGDVVAGADAGDLLERWFADSAVSEIHLHYAARGCFAARVIRA
jgi:hypothetical protein